MFVVTFFREDEKPPEEYNYQLLKHAESHLKLFRDDDSGLYKKIDIREVFV